MVAAALSHVVVGLSVRTLLSLYLPSGDIGSAAATSASRVEVMVFPPVSICHVIGMLGRWGIAVVSVGILPDNNDDGGNDGRGGGEGVTTGRGGGIAIESVKSANTPRTVAILVMQPFGAMAASGLVMRRMHNIADASGIELWEDCAQCYTWLLPPTPLQP
jgi:hypothetical protein